MVSLNVKEGWLSVGLLVSAVLLSLVLVSKVLLSLVVSIVVGLGHGVVLALRYDMWVENGGVST